MQNITDNANTPDNLQLAHYVLHYKLTEKSFPFIFFVQVDSIHRNRKRTRG